VWAAGWRVPAAEVGSARAPPSPAPRGLLSLIAAQVLEHPRRRATGSAPARAGQTAAATSALMQQRRRAPRRARPAPQPEAPLCRPRPPRRPLRSNAVHRGPAWTSPRKTTHCAPSRSTSFADDVALVLHHPVPIRCPVIPLRRLGRSSCGSCLPPPPPPAPHTSPLLLSRHPPISFLHPSPPTSYDDRHGLKTQGR